MSIRYTIALCAGLALVAVTTVSPRPAVAGEFGCKVLLCLASGKTPEECNPPLRKLARRLARGGSFPHCDMVSGEGQQGNARVEYDMVATERCRPGYERVRTFKAMPYSTRRDEYACRSLEGALTDIVTLDAATIADTRSYMYGSHAIRELLAERYERPIESYRVINRHQITGETTYRVTFRDQYPIRNFIGPAHYMRTFIDGEVYNTNYMANGGLYRVDDDVLTERVRID